MADVLLTVGVNPELDFTQFEKDLNAIFSKYEKGNKHTINLEFEISKNAQSSLDNIDNVLKSIQSRADKVASSIKNINGASKDTGKNDSGQAAKNQALYKESIKAIKDYYSVLRKAEKLQTDIVKDESGRFTSQSGDWKELAKQLNSVADAYKRTASLSVKSLPEDLLSKLRGTSLEESNKYSSWLEERRNNSTTKAMKEEEDRIEALVRLRSKATALEDKIRSSITKYSAGANSKNVDSRSAYSNYSTLLSKLKLYKDGLNGTTDSVDVLKGALGQLIDEAEESDRVIKRNGDAHKSWSQTFSNMAQKFSTWISASQVVMAAVRSMKQMVTEAIAVDDAMTQMQIVTKASSSEMSKFGDNAAKVAKQTASSITDVIDSATTYARLGYNMDTSTTLAKYTSMISKVGDIEVADVQSAVTAIVKAFKIDASDTDAIESVFDKMVEVGNNLPVSVSELAEGLNNASSALAAAGNTYEQSLALLAASNATVQDISKSSTGLRTITARIRNMKTELDGLGEAMSDAEYDDIVQALTKYKVSLTDDSGNVRSTYDIFKDIAAVANELKETSQNDYAALAETLAGTRMQNIFFSLVENFNEAEKAMGIMGESAGKLDEAFSTYSNSISAHIQQFKTQFQELSTAVIDSGLANGVVDIGTGFLSLVTSLQKVGALIPTVIALVSAIKSVKSIS